MSVSELNIPNLRMQSSAFDLGAPMPWDVIAGSLPQYLLRARWFGGKARTLRSVRLTDYVPLPYSGNEAYLAISQVDYADHASSDLYAIPLAFMEEPIWAALANGDRSSAIAKLTLVHGDRTSQRIIADPLVDPSFYDMFLGLFDSRAKICATHGDVHMLRTGRFEELRGDPTQRLIPNIGKREQSNSSVVLGERLFAKLFRRLSNGVHPEVEIGRFLTDDSPFAYTPPLAGWAEYRPRGGDSIVLAIVQGYVPAVGDGWKVTCAVVRDALRQAVDRRDEPKTPLLSDVLQGTLQGPSVHDTAIVGEYPEAARTLGARTAELHLALALRTDVPEFAPESYTHQDIAEDMRLMLEMKSIVFGRLGARLDDIPEALRATARTLLAREGEIDERFEAFSRVTPDGQRIRCHGDYHLGQVIRTDFGFVIIDFEGEPSRTLAERRTKRMPLIDVAGMIRSFHYAASSVLLDENQTGALDEPAKEYAERWTDAWQSWASAMFVRGYLDRMRTSSILPRDVASVRTMLDAYLLQKALYELDYELGNRPDWVKIPLRALEQILSGKRTPQQGA